MPSFRRGFFYPRLLPSRRTAAFYCYAPLSGGGALWEVSMNDTTQQKRFDRAVLVGLNASVLTPEENAELLRLLNKLRKGLQ